MSTPSKSAADFYNAGNYAVLGMSRKKKNFGWAVYDSLLKTGVKVYPVHPDGGNVRGVEFYRSVRDLPEEVDSAIICFDTGKSGRVLDDLEESGIKNIWFQHGSYDQSILNEARERNMQVRTGCAIMYIPRAGFPHRLHRFFHELFSKGNA